MKNGCERVYSMKQLTFYLGNIFMRSWSGNNNAYYYYTTPNKTISLKFEAVFVAIFR